MSRIVLLLLIGGGLALFVLSNLSPPVLPLVFLGMQSPALPLTAWIGIAIAAGAITSFCLQFLSYLQRSPGNFEAAERVPPRNRAKPRDERFEGDIPGKPYTAPPPPPRTPTSDWEETVGKDWNLQEEPVTSLQDDFEDERSPEMAESNRDGYETHPETASGSTNGSVYSYSSRESTTKKSGVGKADAVYDANYRVIIPPYQNSAEPEIELEEDDEDEEWGFLDD
ncbi:MULTISPECIES: LapA family protein [unclassified Coleofasciculus]|uniref:LapA family protein n=1 Tax=unclassified Coleofasciculus TaxID=2692782 RepID=UPI001880B0B3|nr:MULTISPECIES: LapA family protein [unclassified Coleofasciculus]MBE9128644.1 LapA family protein [Coleofasciculus sp. LEGE 07081]MBE9147250.1 LapA family protein [Coleofasciculus sp. LEGE 07092]